MEKLTNQLDSAFERLCWWTAHDVLPPPPNAFSLQTVYFSRVLVIRQVILPSSLSLEKRQKQPKKINVLIVSPLIIQRKCNDDDTACMCCRLHQFHSSLIWFFWHCRRRLRLRRLLFQFRSWLLALSLTALTHFHSHRDCLIVCNDNMKATTHSGDIYLCYTLSMHMQTHTHTHSGRLICIPHTLHRNGLCGVNECNCSCS